MNALDPEHVKRSKLRSRDVLDDVLNAVCFVFFVALRTIRVCDFLFPLFNLVSDFVRFGTNFEFLCVLINE